MKIVHVCLGAFFPDGYSYQENMLPKYHRLMGHAVTVVAGLDVFDENGKITFLRKGSEYTNEYGVKIIRLNYKGNIKIAQKFKINANIISTIEKEKPDVLFIHNCQFISIKEIVSYLKKHSGVTVYVDNHADFSNSATNWLSKNILHKVIWKHCAKIIEPYTKKFYGVLPARVDFLTDVYGLPAEKCELLVMGADDELVEKASSPEVRKDIRSKYGISDDDFLIMTGGKIDAFKTQTLLLMDAVNQIESKKVKLIVFGSVTQELKDDVAKRCSDKVQYIGWVKADDSYPLFASCELACFPGRHSVFWEQVTGQGIPMIVKYWSGTTHIDLGGNVILVKGDSMEEIKNDLEFLLKNPKEYEKMRLISQNYGIQVFSYNNIALRAIGL